MSESLEILKMMRSALQEMAEDLKKRTEDELAMHDLQITALDEAIESLEEYGQDGGPGPGQDPNAA